MRDPRREHRGRNSPANKPAQHKPPRQGPRFPPWFPKSFSEWNLGRKPHCCDRCREPLVSGSINYVHFGGCKSGRTGKRGRLCVCRDTVNCRRRQKKLAKKLQLDQKKVDELLGYDVQSWFNDKLLDEYEAHQQKKRSP